MKNGRSPTLSLRARGDLALFTRPEYKTERGTYELPTPSAARGLIEAVLWKPAIAWRVERIRVLKPIRFMAIRRNEVNTRASAPAANVIRNGGTIEHYFAEEDRAQRNAIVLYDVDYVIEACFEMTGKAGPGDNPAKFVEMFHRRVAKGQHFHQPYFGCREFPAEVLPADDAPPPVDLSRELGLMLWDIQYGPDGNRPVFFPARLESGVMEVPADPQGLLVPAGQGGVL